VTAKATIVAEVERLHWRIWDGKAKNAQRSINRIRKMMHVIKAEHSQGMKGVASRKLWHALHAIDHNRLKTLERAMYGRASVELLRARMMPLDCGFHRE
jgi:hypothetical protein